MSNERKPGRELEGIVAHIESLVSGAGFKIISNEKKFDESDGSQLAEFDVVVEGKVGTNDVRILFECRDRPSQGPANAEWVRAVYARRVDYDFNKVIAVSSTGFSKSAIKSAIKLGVELRTFDQLRREDISNWLNVPEIGITKRLYNLIDVGFIVAPDSVNDETKSAINRWIIGRRGDTPILHCADGRVINAIEACTHFQNVFGADRMFEGVVLNGPTVEREFLATYPDSGDQYLIATDVGFVPLVQILFKLNLNITRTAMPFSDARLSRYRKVQSNNAIADIASFDFKDADFGLNLLFSKLEGTNQTILSVKRTK